MMNQMQSRPAMIPDALQALMVLSKEASPVTPQGMPTVAAQKAQEASGIMQGMGGMPSSPMMAQAPGINMAAQRSVQAQQPVTQEQLAKVVQQSQGVAGLPAQNMQGFREGGIIGFSGVDGSSVRLDVEQILKKAPAARTPEENDALRAAGMTLTSRQVGPESGIVTQLDRALADPFIMRALRNWYEKTESGYMQRAGATPEMIAQKLGNASSAAQPPVSDVYPEEGARRVASGITGPAPVAPPAPTPRPPRPSSAPVARPPVAAAQAAMPEAPTLEGAMQAARSVIGLPGTADLRAAEQKAQAAREALGPTGQLGLAALRKQAETDAALEAEADKSRASDRGIAWLLGGAGGRRGGSAAAAVQFDQLDMQRRRLAAERNVVNQTKQDAIIDLNNAKKANDAAAAAQAQARILGAEQKEAEIVAKLAENTFQTQAMLRGQNMTQQTAEKQMANALKVAGVQASARSAGTDLAERRFALQQLRADPEYDAAMKKVKELSKAAGLSNSPTIQNAFRAAQQEALAVAKRYGLGPQDIMGDTGAGAAPAGGQRVIDFSAIK